MIKATESYLASRMSLAEMVGRLESSLDASEIKDAAIIHDFYEYWDPLECVNAPSVDPNWAPDQELARKAAEEMRAFLLEARARFRDYDASRY